MTARERIADALRRLLGRLAHAILSALGALAKPADDPPDDDEEGHA